MQEIESDRQQPPGKRNVRKCRRTASVFLDCIQTSASEPPDQCLAIPLNCLCLLQRNGHPHSHMTDLRACLHRVQGFTTHPASMGRRVFIAAQQLSIPTARRRKIDTLFQDPRLHQCCNGVRIAKALASSSPQCWPNLDHPVAFSDTDLLYLALPHIRQVINTHTMPRAKLAW